MTPFRTRGVIPARAASPDGTAVARWGWTRNHARRRATHEHHRALARLDLQRAGR